MTAADSDNYITKALKVVEESNGQQQLSQNLLAKCLDDYLTKHWHPDLTLTSDSVRSSSNEKKKRKCQSEEIAVKRDQHMQWMKDDLRKSRNGRVYYKESTYPRNLQVHLSSHAQRPAFEKGRSFLRWSSSSLAVEVITVYHSEAVDECIGRSYVEINHHAFSESTTTTGIDLTNTEVYKKLKLMHDNLCDGDIIEPDIRVNRVPFSPTPTDGTSIINIFETPTVNTRLSLSELSLEKPKCVRDLFDVFNALENSYVAITPGEIATTFGSNKTASKSFENNLDLRCKELIYCKYKNLGIEDKIPSVKMITSEFNIIKDLVKTQLGQGTLTLREMAMLYSK